MVYYYSFNLKYLAAFSIIIVITVVTITGVNNDNNNKYHWNNGIAWFVKLCLPRRNQEKCTECIHPRKKSDKNSTKLNLMSIILPDLKGCENSVLWVKDVINT